MLKAVRARSRQDIDAAAKKQIILRVLAWVSKKVEKEVEKAIAAVKQRHADLKKEVLFKPGAASILDADLISCKANQMTLVERSFSPIWLGKVPNPFYVLTSRPIR